MKLLFIILTFPILIYSQEVYTSYIYNDFSFIIDSNKTSGQIFILENEDNYIFNTMKGYVFVNIKINQNGQIVDQRIEKIQLSDSLNKINYRNMRKDFNSYNDEYPGYVKYFHYKIKEKLKNLYFNLIIYEKKEFYELGLTFRYK